jgi:hypothetical protein
MSDEYLWDRSGDPDPLVAELEDKLAGLAFEPVFLVEEAAPAAAAAAPRVSSWRGYFIGSAVTAMAVACSVMLFWCGYRAGVDAPPREPAAQPIVVGVPDSAAEDREEPPPSTERVDVDVDADAEEQEAPPEPMRTADARDTLKSVKGKSKTKASTAKDPLDALPSSSSSSSTKSSTPSSPSSKGSDVDIDCILDPEGCGKAKSSSSSSSSPKPPSGSSDPSLPEKLTTFDIREGMAPVKAAAKACGPQHGANPGEKVKVKLSISGATGAVTSATADAPHTITPLGICVAAAAKRAKFKRFQKASLGAVYPFAM